MEARARAAARLRTGSLWAAVALWLALIHLTWLDVPFWSSQPWWRAPVWDLSPVVAAPLTRRLLFYHPAAAWTAFAAYFLVFALSVAYLNERRLSYDRPARAAAEVGFAFNTIALVTGTLWGLQEWSRTGEHALVTVYSDPKVLVVLVTWFAFAAYLLLRRFIDEPVRRARLAGVFGILGFLGVPLSFAVSRVLQTSLHPNLAGPGADPGADLGPAVGGILALSLLAFLALFLHIWLQRDRILRAEERLEELEPQEAP